jgi:multiple antibiotic resistance protein
MIELFITVTASLFSVVNPLGAVPVYLALTPNYTTKERNRTALTTSLYFVLILLAFFFAGSLILKFFGLSLNALRIAGGLVILNSGYALLSGKFAQSRAMDKSVRKEALTKDDISFAPMAMPMLSGPGSISLLIGMFATHEDWSIRSLIAGVILLNGIIVYIILRTSPGLNRILGVAGLQSISRIMGFIVMGIGIEYMISGVVSLVQHLTGG